MFLVIEYILDVLSELKHYTNILIDNFSNVNLKIYTILIVALLFLILHKLRNIPILSTISVYFSFFPVLIHELGHAFAAKIIGGHVDDIRMILSEKQQQKTGVQGYANTRASDKLEFIVIAFFGYIASPLMLYFGVYFAYKDMTFIFLFLCILFLFFYFFMTKQKWIPLILIIAVVYACYNIIFQQYSLATSSTTVIYNILLGLLLGETIQSIIITTEATFSKQNFEWDGTTMQNLTLIPVTFWWLIWTLFSVFSMYKVFGMLFS